MAAQLTLSTSLKILVTVISVENFQFWQISQETVVFPDICGQCFSPCDICGQCFSPCDICGQCFSTDNTMRMHKCSIHFDICFSSCSVENVTVTVNKSGHTNVTYVEITSI